MARVQLVMTLLLCAACSGSGAGEKSTGAVVQKASGDATGGLPGSATGAPPGSAGTGVAPGGPAQLGPSASPSVSPPPSTATRPALPFQESRLRGPFVDLDAAYRAALEAHSDCASLEAEAGIPETWPAGRVAAGLRDLAAARAPSGRGRAHVVPLACEPGRGPLPGYLVVYIGPAGRVWTTGVFGDVFFTRMGVQHDFAQPSSGGLQVAYRLDQQHVPYDDCAVGTGACEGTDERAWHVLFLQPVGDVVWARDVTTRLEQTREDIHTEATRQIRSGHSARAVAGGLEVDGRLHAWPRGAVAE